MLGSLLPYPHSPTQLSNSTLFVVATSAASQVDVVTVTTLAGWLARDSVPQIFTVDKAVGDSGDSNAFWLGELEESHAIKLNSTFINNVTALIELFASRLSGYVRFDPNSTTGSANAAITRCAAGDGLVAVGSSRMAELLEGLGVAQSHDSSDETPLEALDAGSLTLSNRMSLFAPDDGSKSHCMAGYAVFARMPVADFPQDGSAASRALIARLNNSEQLGAAFGWQSWDEFHYVRQLSASGAYAHASDWSQDLYALANLAAHASVRRRPRLTLRAPSRAPPQAAAAAEPAAVKPGAAAAPAPPAHTVAFVMSDGDNLCWLQGGWRGAAWYGSADRGKVPIGWSFSAAGVELLPTVLEWAQAGATANDSFVAAPSGAGYAYPDELLPARRGAFAEASADLMARGRMDFLNVIGAAPAAESLEPLLAQEQIQGVFYWTYGAGYSGLRGNVAYVHGKPVIGGRRSLWGDGTDPASTMVGPAALVEALASLPKEPSDPNSYSLIPVHAWSHNVSTVRQVAEALERRGGFDVVSPARFVELLTTRTGREQQCPMPRGAWSRSCLDCTLSGNGTCVLDCGDCGGQRATCDLAACSDGLSLNEKHAFVCADGTLCPTGGS